MKLLEALKAKGIARVEIAFDGAGDSGDIEGIACWSHDNKEVPAGDLEDALYDLGEKVLTRHYITFDDEGCYGEIVLDVETGQVEVEVNVRYVETELETHQRSLDEYLGEGAA